MNSLPIGESRQLLANALAFRLKQIRNFQWIGHEICWDPEHHHDYTLEFQCALRRDCLKNQHSN